MVVLGTSWPYAISILSPRFLISISVFSGRKFVGSSLLSNSVYPPRFCVNHLPGAVCSRYIRCRSHRKLAGGIQGQACSCCLSRGIFHRLLYRYGVEVRILFPRRFLGPQLITANSTMYLVFRNHWGKLFNDDPGMVYSFTSQL